MSNEQNKPLTAAEYWNENSRCFPEGDFMQEDQQVMKWEEFRAYSAAKDAEIERLREELEEAKTAYCDKVNEARFNFDHAQQYQRELEAVKNERDALKKEAQAAYDDMNEVIVQRDEAVKVLEAVQRIKPLVQYPDTIGVEFTDEARAVAAAMYKVDTTLSRLSSGETKQVSPWISAEEKPPTVGERYNFINDNPGSNHYGEIFGGKYMGFNFGFHEFGLPGYSMTAKLYCPIPAPPESNDKK